MAKGLITQQTLSRVVEQKAFVDSSEVSVDIPRVQDINSIKVTVRGTVTIGTDAATGLSNESPAGLISRFDFVANGKDVLDQVSGAKASVGNYARRFASNNVEPGLTVDDHEVRAVYRLDRDIIDGIRPKDSSFQAYLTNLLQLRMVTGEANADTTANVLVQPDATTTIAFTGTIDVEVESTLEVSGDAGEPKFVKKTTRQVQNVTGANSNLEFRMPTGNLVRAVHLRCLDDGAPTNDLLTNLEFNVDGVDVRYKGTFDGCRDKNASDKEISIGSVPTGHAVIDFCRPVTSGVKLSQAVDLRGASESKLVVENTAPVGTTGTIEVTIEEYIPPSAG